jgi:hypothetical protein
MTLPVPRTIHFTQLQPVMPGSPLAEEWETYRREVGRLLAEGHEGRFVLIKGVQPIGIWNSRQEALTEGMKRFLNEPFLLKQILTNEPMLKTGYNKICRN